MTDSVEGFYDSISGDYTEFVYRCVPRYNEMLSALLAYLPDDFSPKSALELGCGTGNLTRLIYRHFPGARVRAVDLSGECIQECRGRVPDADIEYIVADFRQLDFPGGSFDLIMSSIAIHHLEDGEKERLFGKTFEWLAPGGVLAFSDQFRGETDRLYHKHLRSWQEFAFDRGATEDEWNMWMEHQERHDHHASLLKHMDWLRSAGYGTVDCTWRYLLWATLYSAKA